MARTIYTMRRAVTVNAGGRGFVMERTEEVRLHGAREKIIYLTATGANTIRDYSRKNEN